MFKSNYFVRVQLNIENKSLLFLFICFLQLKWGWNELMFDHCSHWMSFPSDTTKQHKQADVCSTPARLRTEPTATVAWQLSRASGGAKWTDTHKKTWVETSVQGRSQAHTHTHTQQQTAERRARRLERAQQGASGMEEQTSPTTEGNSNKFHLFFPFSEFPFW